MESGPDTPVGSLWSAVRACRPALAAAAAFSLAINLLFLTYPLYMLQIYDRVLASGNAMTLIMLTVIAVGAIFVLGILDVVRSRLLNRVSLRLDRHLRDSVLESALHSRLKHGRDPGGQPVRDLDEVRQLVSGSVLRAVFDVPWVPVYLGALFLLQPWLGIVGVAGAVIVALLVVCNELMTRRLNERAAWATMQSYAFAENYLRNSEAVETMGLRQGLASRWNDVRESANENQLAVNDRNGLFSSLVRALRLGLQILVLAAGAWLVAIEQLATAGIIFAGSILLGRALLPIDQAIGLWRPLVSGWQAWHRVVALLAGTPRHGQTMALPAPRGEILVEKLVYVPPNARQPALKGVSLHLAAGETLGVIGRSAAGKSTLARLLVGAVAPTAGTVRLDGAELAMWRREDLARHLGYLPQDIELFPGSVADNIARFSRYDDAAVIAAAKLAGVHEMILSLSDGYHTRLGPEAEVLSAGQTQRIALARALYGDPMFIVLDEPNSNLDIEGEQALVDALFSAKQRGATIVVITHRRGLLRNADRVLLVQDGLIGMLGPRDEIMEKITRRAIRPVDDARQSHARTAP